MKITVNTERGEENINTTRSIMVELRDGNTFKINDNNGSLRVEKIEGIMSVIPEELRRIEIN